jgi:mannose/fructose/N-acetylgalactosamine-specific phosphotransferase system component IID
LIDCRGKPWARSCTRPYNRMLLALEGAAVIRKQRDHATTIGVVAILLGLIVIGGITYTYITRPTLIEAAAKRVLDIRQLFEDTFR